MSDFFKRLSAVAKASAGTAAVQLGDNWVVVDYNVDGRISWHQTFDSEGCYSEPAAFHSYTGGEIPPEQVDFLSWVLEPDNWVQLDQ